MLEREMQNPKPYLQELEGLEEAKEHIDSEATPFINTYKLQ